jgi:hypothetical protein
MTDNKRRHERLAVNEPTSVKSGDDQYDGTITDISRSGVAVEFDFNAGQSPVQFDIGNRVEMDSSILDSRNGRVVRHYDKGFAVNFEGESRDRGNE